MPKPDATIYLVQVEFGGFTWNTQEGGPQSISIDYGGNNIPFWSGNNLFPVFNPTVDLQFSINIDLSEFFEEVQVNQKGDLKIIIQKPDETTIEKTYPDMIFNGSSATQGRAAYGSRTCRWNYEADDGLYDPVFGTPTPTPTP